MGRLLRDVEIGLWYENVDNNGRFEVVAMDEADHTIEIQYFDGTLEEIDYEFWSQMGVEESAPPDDDSGALDSEYADYDVNELLTSGFDDSAQDIEQISYGDTLY